MTEYLNPADLTHRQVYLLHARNLTIGAWDAESGCFYGIRDKFGLRLDCEYPETAHAYTPLPHVVPDGILLQETLKNPYERGTNRELVRQGTPPNLQYFYKDDGTVKHGYDVYMNENKMLFMYLQWVEANQNRPAQNHQVGDLQPAGHDAIPVGELRHRHVYKVDARTFTVGVWDADTSSFLGRSFSYGRLYVEREYEQSVTVRPGRHGSAWAEAELTIMLPDTITDLSDGRAPEQDTLLTAFLVELEAQFRPDTN
jgi:hypothetical protein